jgi:hypothetical protein
MKLKQKKNNGFTGEVDHAKSESCCHKGCVEGGEENSGFTQVHLALVGHA